MQLWLQDPHSVEKLMDMKRLEKKGVCVCVTKSSMSRNRCILYIQHSMLSEIIIKRLRKPFMFCA